MGRKATDVIKYPTNWVNEAWNARCAQRFWQRAFVCLSMVFIFVVWVAWLMDLVPVWLSFAGIILLALSGVLIIEVYLKDPPMPSEAEV